jgi:acetylornithine/succinyldiaminopimelate/putrescine aminotransferase
MGALSVTHDPHYRDPFAPLIGPVTFVDPNRPETLLAAVGDRTAAIIAEPIRGEGGVRPLPESFVRAVADVTARTGTLLIADEVQPGSDVPAMASTSRRLAGAPIWCRWARPLARACPSPRRSSRKEWPARFSAGDHGTTYGGNLLACRAALFFLEQLMDHGLLDHVREMGAHFERQLRTLALKHPVIEEVRGAGLMRGLQLTVDATPIVDGARDRGLIVNRTSEKVVRMLPPLNIEKADLDRAVEILDDVFVAVHAEVRA